MLIDCFVVQPRPTHGTSQSPAAEVNLVLVELRDELQIRLRHKWKTNRAPNKNPNQKHPRQKQAQPAKKLSGREGVKKGETGAMNSAKTLSTSCSSTKCTECVQQEGTSVSGKAPRAKHRKHGIEGHMRVVVTASIELGRHEDIGRNLSHNLTSSFHSRLMCEYLSECGHARIPSKDI